MVREVEFYLTPEGLPAIGRKYANFDDVARLMVLRLMPKTEYITRNVLEWLDMELSKKMLAVRNREQLIQAVMNWFVDIGIAKRFDDKFTLIRDKADAFYTLADFGISKYFPEDIIARGL